MYTVYWLHYTHETDIATQGYVGVTKNLKERIMQHQSDVRRNRDSRPVVKVLNEHGKESVEVATIMQGTKDECYAKELELRPEPSIGWNDRAGGIQVVHSEQARDAISNANTGAVSARKGVKNTPEHTAKMVATRMRNGNYVQSEETKTKISNATSYEKSHKAKGIILTIGGKEYSYNCIRRCAVKHDLGYSTIRSRLRLGKTHEINGYSVRYG